MQTDILLKQVLSSLANLKTAIDKFEKHSSPSTQYAEQLHHAMNYSNKLVAAYVVLKEQKDVSPELDLHLKIMSAEQPKPELIVEAKKEEPILQEPIREEVKPEVKPVVEIPKEAVQAPAVNLEKEKTPEPVHTPPPTVSAVVTPAIPVHPDVPKLSVSINDKFRFINDLFASNANEYGIAIEQLNNVGSKEEADTYLKGLKNIYHWDEEHEMVKKLYALNQKRFL